MNNTDQNYTDNFFKQGLSSPPEFSPSDKNWEEMERLLAPKTKRRSIGWIYAVSGVAAAILIFLSLWLPSVNTNIGTQNAEAVKGPQKSSEVRKTTHLNPNDVSTNDSQGGSISSLHNIVNNSLSASSIRKAVKGNQNEGIRPGGALQAAEHLGLASIREASSPVNSALYLNIQTSPLSSFVSQRDIDLPNPFSSKTKATVADKDDPDVRTTAPSSKWALSLALSPDVNAVQDMKAGRPGLSMGMGLSYKLGKALSLGTGVYLSQKLYSADKASYKATEKPFATWASYSKRIDADCRVIDVPVNLSLRISNKTSNKLYASAGMSSYIMLSEKYDFVYNNPSPAFPTGRREYIIRNENRHILNIVNLAVALEKPLSDRVSLVIQPYAKLPLTGIGQGQTNLKSVGIGFALNYSLKKK